MRVWCAVRPDGCDEDNRRVIATGRCDRTKKISRRLWRAGWVLTVFVLFMKRDSSVSVTTWLLARRPENRCSISDRDIALSFTRLSNRPWCPLRLPVRWVSGIISRRVKKATRGADHSLPPSLYSGISFRPYDFLTWCLIEHRSDSPYLLLSGVLTLRIALISVY